MLLWSLHDVRPDFVLDCKYDGRTKLLELLIHWIAAYMEEAPCKATVQSTRIASSTLSLSSPLFMLRVVKFLAAIAKYCLHMIVMPH